MIWKNFTVPPRSGTVARRLNNLPVGENNFEVHAILLHGSIPGEWL